MNRDFNQAVFDDIIFKKESWRENGVLLASTQRGCGVSEGTHGAPEVSPACSWCCKGGGPLTIDYRL